ncbi:MAG TPA: hypothetical protein PLN31_04780 [Azoarcus taiwanensis]|uniref:Uncharacterized protein n=1 Tax=Azoarcus taiwanensis TaxID=666964 RepID=A0A972J8G8_9RHOO|nr:hypothetical protein [Azoarcus taiwanensis]NMG01660.1 hypothetical protein [Azoarcus taiwanensis]HRQ56711.1 hypothetical protein [Azoarcus taiwanensis]
MSTATTTLNPQDQEAPRERPFIIELFSLIARVFATAIAINLVFAAFVLLLAGNASAKGPDILPGVHTVIERELPPGRDDRCSAMLAPTVLELALLHRIGASPMPPTPIEER